MSVRLVFPDRLEWPSGIEFGLAAVAAVRRDRKGELQVVVERRGSRFEPVGYAAYQLGLLDCLMFSEGVADSARRGDVVVLPRLSRDTGSPSSTFLVSGVTVLTSEPGVPADPPSLLCFPRWEFSALADLLRSIARS